MASDQSGTAVSEALLRTAASRLCQHLIDRLGMAVQQITTAIPSSNQSCAWTADDAMNRSASPDSSESPAIRDMALNSGIARELSSCCRLLQGTAGPCVVVTQVALPNSDTDRLSTPCFALHGPPQLLPELLLAQTQLRRFLCFESPLGRLCEVLPIPPLLQKTVAVDGARQPPQRPRHFVVLNWHCDGGAALLRGEQLCRWRCQQRQCSMWQTYCADRYRCCRRWSKVAQRYEFGVCLPQRHVTQLTPAAPRHSNGKCAMGVASAYSNGTRVADFGQAGGRLEKPKGHMPDAECRYLLLVPVISTSELADSL